MKMIHSKKLSSYHTNDKLKIYRIAQLKKFKLFTNNKILNKQQQQKQQPQKPHQHIQDEIKNVFKNFTNIAQQL
jgi:hypothetical protein